MGLHPAGQGTTVVMLRRLTRQGTHQLTRSFSVPKMEARCSAIPPQLGSARSVSQVYTKLMNKGFTAAPRGALYLVESVQTEPQKWQQNKALAPRTLVKLLECCLAGIMLRVRRSWGELRNFLLGCRFVGLGHLILANHIHPLSSTLSSACSMRDHKGWDLLLHKPGSLDSWPELRQQGTTFVVGAAGQGFEVVVSVPAAAFNKIVQHIKVHHR